MPHTSVNAAAHPSLTYKNKIQNVSVATDKDLAQN